MEIPPASSSAPSTISTLPLDTSTTPNPVTLQHVLNLPAVLHQINPYLAALHVARIRLLSLQTQDGTGSTLGNVDLEKISRDWCKSCGGLREAVVGKKKRKVLGDGKGVTVRAGSEIGGKHNQRKECDLCGEAFARKSSSKVFPPARRVMRSRTSSHNLPVPAIASGSPSINLIPPHQASHPSSSSENLSRHSIPPTILSSPTLSYISQEAPNPPTYPQPASEKFSTSPSSNAFGLTGAESTKGIKKKKGKKSGLAKLLAASREREEGEKLGGWGFG